MHGLSALDGSISSVLIVSGVHDRGTTDEKCCQDESVGQIVLDLDALLVFTAPDPENS